MRSCRCGHGPQPFIRKINRSSRTTASPLAIPKNRVLPLLFQNRVCLDTTSNRWDRSDPILKIPMRTQRATSNDTSPSERQLALQGHLGTPQKNYMVSSEIIPILVWLSTYSTEKLLFFALSRSAVWDTPDHAPSIGGPRCLLGTAEGHRCFKQAGRASSAYRIGASMVFREPRHAVSAGPPGRRRRLAGKP